jgi:hypothetical protein
VAMKPEKLVEHLENAVRKVGYTIRLEKGNFHGGRCIFASEHLVFLNRRMAPEERADILAKVLSDQNLDEIFLVPEVRAFVEKYIPKPAEENPKSEIQNPKEESPAEEDPAPQGESQE